ncbi:DEAD/DEAH box helicase [Mesorhizobium sp. CA16]|uniref:DEAD/DEAH box helicase n=1 Tax=Mesorhizobium sp. CA16 TaxID=588496 RepID=UPI001CC97B83|nr:DEAD/DEAH box helicase [Mesorhizobium sp. CA16]MBZ9912788.1 DEAD/DEAH box helicase [Mesorhizobium sp. CA16]
MSLGNTDWRSLNGLNGGELKGEVFSILQDASFRIQTGQLDDPELLAVVPRLAELMTNKPELQNFGEVFSALARSLGLWNYVDRRRAAARDELAAERATVPALGITLHREQLSALHTLLAGKNLILSAPTSFGKSILIDVLLLHEKFRRVAIVLPTIALLDEFRRRLLTRFGDRFDVLMHHSEKAERERVIFLGTQERLINRDDLGTLDLAVVDEFYKLDPKRKDERAVTLNAAVYRILGRAKQFFFLGPNIENVLTAEGSRWGFEFLRTRFSTVAVDTIDLKSVPDKDARLYYEIQNAANWPALVFVSSPDKANGLASGLVERKVKLGSGQALSRWMVDNYGGKWELSEAIAAGVGVHHGRIPRSLASRFVFLFNEKKLPILICTSTLIEGVNTAAKSVLIYDKTIANRPYDFFTFSNIRGRAGRLGQHHVGQVFLFHEPPDREDVEVTAPLFGDPDEAPDEFVVHMEEGDVSSSVSDRVQDMAQRVGLDPSDIRRFSGLGIETLVGLRAATAAAMRARADLIWSGRPSYNQLKALCSLVCSVEKPQTFGCSSASQLTLYISKLRQYTTMRAFYHWHSSSYRGEPQKIDNVFKFLRAAEYSLPEYFAVVELFVKARAPDQDASYALLLAELPRWFRAEPLKILEEQGVPIQISERFLRTGDSVTTLGLRLRTAANNESKLLSPMERQWITDALPR